MVVNLNKTKEIVTGPPSKTSRLPLLHLSLRDIERVNSVKLLGINLDADLSWKSHVEAITSKATQRLCFLKQLRRAGVPQAQLLYFYTGVIRPVLEYAAPEWNHLLTKHKLTKLKRYKDELSELSTATLTTCPTLPLYIVLPFPALQTGENSSHVSFQNQSSNPHLAYLPSYLSHGIPQLLPD